MRPRRILLTAAAAVLAVGLMAEPATAETTWTIQPGGQTSYTSGKTTLKDTKTGTTLTCTSASLAGRLKSGSGLSGTHAGSLTGGTLSNCGGPEGLVFAIKLLDLPWRINLTSYASGAVHGTISHIEISLAATGCSFVVDGTRGGASNGVLDFTYSDATHALKTTGGNLHIYDVSGCLGLVSSGDPVKITATFILSPAQSITSP